MIKLFEEFGMDGYEFIDAEEYGAVYWSDSKQERYTPSELVKLGSEPYNFTCDTRVGHDDTGANLERILNPRIKDNPLIVYNIYITKCKDEWFYVKQYYASWHKLYYKCDQFDGLLTCLKNECNL